MEGLTLSGEKLPDVFPPEQHVGLPGGTKITFLAIERKREVQLFSVALYLQFTLEQYREEDPFGEVWLICMNRINFVPEAESDDLS